MGQQLSVAKQEGVPQLRQIDPNYYQERIEEHNDEYDGALLIANSDRSLQFALLDKNGFELWRKPARAEWVAMSERAERLAIFGKTEGEGFGTLDGKTYYQGVDFFDFAGNQIMSLETTPVIVAGSVSPQGELLVAHASGINCYDDSGSLLWQKNSFVHDAQFIGDGNYIKTLLWDKETDNFTIQLLRVRTGQTIRAWTYGRSNEKSILYVDPANGLLLLSEYAPTSAPSWNLVLLDINTWESVASLNGLKAGVFSVAANKQGKAFAMMLLQPGTVSNANSREVLIGLWNTEDDSWESHSIGAKKVNFYQDKITFDDRSKQYVVRIGETKIFYER